MNAEIKKKLAIFVAVLVFAVLFLLPTLYREGFKGGWISKPIKLGLDLIGGVYLVYKVESKEAVKSRLQGMAQVIKSDLKKKKVPVRRAQVNDKNQIEFTLLSDRFIEKVKAKVSDDFRNLRFEEVRDPGGRPVVVFSISKQDALRIEKESVSQAIETLRNRVDQFGVAEPLIQRSGTDRINLQMPGVSDIEAVKKVVGSVAKLEFRFIPKPGSNVDTITLKDRETGDPVIVEDEVQMTGDAVDDARVQIYNSQVEVSLTLTSEGGRLFRKITSANVGRNLAIILDGLVYSSPVIREAIGGGRASISGRFSVPEAKQLAVVLRAGALPAPLTVLEERTVGPTLGAESIKKAMIAIAAGSACVLLFMLIYYKKSGLVAIGCLLLNLVLIVSALAALGFTLTLPGLAALALTVGMAVDANVIIFERIREEIRNGATRDAAVEGGYGKAFSAIFDSNITSLLLALILFSFGSGPIKGFAVVLGVGILSTLYSAVFVGRLAFDALPIKGAKGLSI